MRKWINKIAILAVFFCMALSMPSAVTAATAITAPKMRVGCSSQSFSQMTNHSSASYTASKAKRPYKINNASGEQVCYSVRQKIPRKTYSKFKIVDKLDSCIRYDSLRVLTSDGKTDYTWGFKVTTSRSGSATIVTIKATSKMLKILKSKSLTLDFYIVTITKGNTAAVKHGHTSGKYWRIRNYVTSYLGKTRKKSNYSYIYGNKKSSATAAKTTTGSTTSKSSNKVTLCYANGKIYKTITNNDGNNTFPSVYMKNSGYNVIGWSKSKNKTTNPTYMEGDKIPAGSGTYYMVAYTEKKINRIYHPKDNTVIFFVGDSRFVHVKWNLQEQEFLSCDGETQNRIFDGKIEFIAECGQGIEWFESTGYAQLKTKLAKNKGKNNVVIFGLGGNDAGSSTRSASYVSRMKSISNTLKKTYGCKLYYANVWPVNSAALGSTSTLTVQQVQKMNTYIDTLCSGGYFTKIDLYSYFLKNGWEYNGADLNNSDGIHPSRWTALKIYNYCMKIVGYSGYTKI